MGQEIWLSVLTNLDATTGVASPFQRAELGSEDVGGLVNVDLALLERVPFLPCVENVAGCDRQLLAALQINGQLVRDV